MNLTATLWHSWPAYCWRHAAYHFWAMLPGHAVLRALLGAILLAMAITSLPVPFLGKAIIALLHHRHSRRTVTAPSVDLRLIIDLR